MRGYHYTSKKNWEKIQKDGFIKKYRIGAGKEEMEQFFPGGVSGVWLWKDNPSGESHAGNIIYQVGTKGDPEIVKLEVDYKKDRVVSYNGRHLNLSHVGKVENWRYHNGDESVIVDMDIPVKNIRLVSSYNTVQRLS